jgi:hypothetical protein
VIAHDKITIAGHLDGAKVAKIVVLRWDVRLGKPIPGDVDETLRISTVSPGQATMRLMKDVVPSGGYSKTTTSPVPDRLKLVDDSIDELRLVELLICCSFCYASALNVF